MIVSASKKDLIPNEIQTLNENNENLDAKESEKKFKVFYKNNKTTIFIVLLVTFLIFLFIFLYQNNQDLKIKEKTEEIEKVKKAIEVKEEKEVKYIKEEVIEEKVENTIQSKIAILLSDIKSSQRLINDLNQHDLISLQNIKDKINEYEKRLEALKDAKELDPKDIELGINQLKNTFQQAIDKKANDIYNNLYDLGKLEVNNIPYLELKISQYENQIKELDQLNAFPDQSNLKENINKEINNLQKKIAIASKNKQIKELESSIHFDTAMVNIVHQKYQDNNNLKEMSESFQNLQKKINNYKQQLLIFQDSKDKLDITNLTKKLNELIEKSDQQKEFIEKEQKLQQKGSLDWVKYQEIRKPMDGYQFDDTKTAEENITIMTSMLKNYQKQLGLIYPDQVNQDYVSKNFIFNVIINAIEQIGKEVTKLPKIKDNSLLQHKKSQLKEQFEKIKIAISFFKLSSSEINDNLTNGNSLEEIDNFLK